MTLAQEVKRALKDSYEIISCRGGTGTATGWVDLKIAVGKYELKRSTFDIERKMIKELITKGVELYRYDNGGSYQAKYCFNVHTTERSQ